VCTNYTPTARDRFKASRLGIAHLPVKDWPPEVFPGYEAPIVVRQDAGAPLLEIARFGLMPRWSRDAAHAQQLARGTYNARSETAAQKPSFRSAWRERQWALAPMDNYFEPMWEDAASNGGKSVRWRIARADGDPFACAALWERWSDNTTGEIITSFSLLTVNADGHALCGRLHRPGDEKRMPVIIAANDYDAWLHATPHEAQAFMRTTPTDLLVGAPAPRAPLKAAPKVAAKGASKVTTPSGPAGEKNLPLF
jgi:putative SOS response-associated peptidase YedK